MAQTADQVEGVLGTQEVLVEQVKLVVMMVVLETNQGDIRVVVEAALVLMAQMRLLQLLAVLVVLVHQVQSQAPQSSGLAVEEEVEGILAQVGRLEREVQRLE